MKKGYVRPSGPDETPRPGDIVLWDKGKYAVGHMGYYAGPDPKGGNNFEVYSATLKKDYIEHKNGYIDRLFWGYYRLQQEK